MHYRGAVNRDHPRVDRRTFLRLLGATGAIGLAAPLLPGWGAGVAIGQDVDATLPDVDGLAADLDYDIERIFQAVVAIGYDAYPGALRGPLGTLRGGRGNSTDQALLLGALLDAALVKHRYVIGSIDAGTFDGQVGSRPTDPVTARAAAASVVLPPDVVDAWGTSPAWARDADIDQVFKDAQAWVGTTVDMISSALTAAKVPLGAPTIASDLERDQHVWVQFQSGTEWIDLDPSVPEAVAGTAYGSQNDVVDVLPDALYHMVTVRIAAEVVQAGVPARTVPISHQVRAADIDALPIYVSHAPAAWLDIAGALTGEQRYIPLIGVGSQIVEGDQVMLSAGGGIIDVLGGGPGDPEGQTLAEWLEFDVDVPGQPTTSTSRLLFDRLTPAQRASGDLQLEELPPVSVTHIDDEVGDVFLPFAATQIVTVASHALPWGLFSPPTTAVPTSPPTFEETTAQGAFALDHLRDLLELQLMDSRGTTSWAGRPLVTWMQLAPLASTGDGPNAVQTRVDLIDHIRTPGTLEGFAPEQAGILAGVLDHAAERMLVAASTGYLAPGTKPNEISVGRVFEVAAESGLQPIVLAPDSSTIIEGASTMALDLMRTAQAAGRYVIVPPSAVTIGDAQRIGWWEYDPANGQVSDRLDDGGGVELSEQSLLIIRIATKAACAFAVLGSIAFVAKAAQGKLNSLTDFTDSVASAGGGIAGCAAGGFALP